MKIWAQGDCVELDVPNAFHAPRVYRDMMARAEIAVSTEHPDGIRVRELTAQVRSLEQDMMCLLEWTKQAADDMAHWESALSEHLPSYAIAISATRRALLDSVGSLTGEDPARQR